MTGFQTAVNFNPAPAVAGDFASANPRASVLAGPSALVAGALGAYVGRFCWLSAAQVDGDGAPALVNFFGGGPVAGFVHRNMQALITAFLQESTMLIPPGFQMAVHSAGDFWVVNDGAGAALVGQKAYANYADGKATFAAAGSPAQGSDFTGAVTEGTASVTASIAEDIMTVTAVGSGVLVVGGVLTGGVAGTLILAQISGTTGGVGTYRVSIPQTLASTTVTESYGILTVSAVSSGTIGVGQVLAGTGVATGTYVASLGTGVGGVGTYVVVGDVSVGSTAITGTSNVETKWICMSPGAPGALVKITSWPLG